MSFLIDTNICSAFAKGNRDVFTRFQQYYGRLYIATISIGELTTWVIRSQLAEPTRVALERFLQDVPCLNFDYQTAVKYGELRASQLERGVPMPVADLLIASTALIHDLTLVTHNVKDFVNVEGLRIEDWLAT
ncbi:MAG TPA: type II toxin-antitoxin system VapC family toxin [Pirellulaceae bacterium]|nr:type II toxin-antitoxin system VapC family toxin [Pirellulaceae bacterium]